MTKTKKKTTKPKTPKLAELLRERQEDEALRNRMAQLLTGTANALHGGANDDGEWDWSNLPKLAEILYANHAAADALVAKQATALKCLKEYLRSEPDPVKAKRGTAYAQMVENCEAHGLTPLSPEQFAMEDQRMVTELVRRNNGLDPNFNPGWGSYSDGPCVRSASVRACVPVSAPLDNRNIFERLWDRLFSR